MKTLIVFYSRTGNTRKIGELIAQKLHADIDEIIDLKNRKGILGFIFGGRDAMKEYLTKITFTKNPADYDLVIVGTPMWAGSSTPAFRTYLTENKGKIKKAALFVTAGGEGPQKTVTILENILDKPCLASVGWLDSEVKQDDLQPKLDSFIKAIGK